MTHRQLTDQASTSALQHKEKAFIIPLNIRCTTLYSRQDMPVLHLPDIIHTCSRAIHFYTSQSTGAP